MGGIILVASAIIWALSYFPRYSEKNVPEQYTVNSIAELKAYNHEALDSLSDRDVKELVLSEYQQENSILGKIGKFVEPVMRPMDFDWRATVSLLAGLPAKEVVVSTMGVLYTGNGDDAELLAGRLKTPSPISGQPPFTPLSAYAFMVFVLLYFPCIATLVAIVKETGSWKWGMFSLFYNTILAWIVSTGIVQIGLLF